jgi:hypothetical protein
MPTEAPYPETWGPERYGDPCRECGLAWSFTADDAIVMVSGMADAYEATIGAGDGSLAHPDLGWTVGGYVCHVADNLNIWAQWLAGAALAGEVWVPGYEEPCSERPASTQRSHCRAPSGSCARPRSRGCSGQVGPRSGSCWRTKPAVRRRRGAQQRP